MTGGTVDLREDREGTAGREPDDDEGRFRLLIDGVEDSGIILLDPWGGILTWNTGAERLTGYRAEEVLGRYFSALQSPGPEPTGSIEPTGVLAAATGRGAGRASSRGGPARTARGSGPR